MAKIFISYRRDDTQYQADKLYELIKPMVPDPDRDIFIDVDNIPLGVDFVDHLGERVGQCDVLLALIGGRWLDTLNPKTQERRLDDQDDFVRIEIAQALKRNIRVIPIMFDGAQLPSETQLPDELKPLVRRNGIPISRSSFEHDAKRLLKGLGLEETDEGLPDKSTDVSKQDLKGVPKKVETGVRPTKLLGPLLSFVLLAALGAGLYSVDPLGWFNHENEPDSFRSVNEDFNLERDLSQIDLFGPNINLRENFIRLNTNYEFKRFERLAENGNIVANILLGAAYEVGIGVDRNLIRAREYYERSCNRDEARGCVFLGYLYDQAMGVSQNYILAREYYNMSCEGGSPLGCNNLGYFTEKGLGGLQDEARARELYVWSCNRGENLGCGNLAALDQAEKPKE